MKLPALQIVKIGGKILENAALLAPVLQGFAELEVPAILVHGGGKKASELGDRLGTPARMVDGRRITDAATLDIVTMVYAGLYNKQLVARLQATGINALGLTGADGNLIRAHKRVVRDLDYGFVGDIDAIDAEGIHQLLTAGFTPVFCAITHDKQGQLLNTNADTITSEVARALTARYAVQLLYCFEKPGVLLDPDDDTSVISELSFEQYQHYQAQGVIHSGMLPKLDNAFAGLRAGLQEVRIGGPGALATGGGTRLKL